MREDFPSVSYERNMNHNYMVLYQCDFFGAAKDSSRDYRVRMLLENKIEGLLPITHRQVNGENRYYYEINSLQPLDRMIEKSELRYRELRTVLLGCVNLFDRLEEFLLNGEQIVMKSEFIYVNVESMEPYFVCYPNYTGDVRCSFMEFVDELLAHIDHTDEQAVMLGYQVYRYTRNPNYIIGEISRFMECVAAGAVSRADCYRAEYHKDRTGECCIAAGDGAAEMNNRAWENKKLKEDCNRSKAKNYDTCDDEEDGGVQNKKGSIKDFIGGVFCVFVALCAGAVIFGARVLKCFKLSGDNELYMYGAVAMALVAAVLFFACYIKTVRQNREIALLNGEDEEYDEHMYEKLIKRDVVNNLTAKEGNKVISSAMYYGEGISDSSGYSSNTVCLEGAAIEERVLRGRVNGREVNVPLDCLPLTVGKLGGVSDYIINDNAVSKIHARFEEHEGKVCVCDLNSTNGTVRNGEMIAINTPVPLEPGDTLRFGRSCFTYY